MPTDFEQFKELTSERRVKELQKLIDKLKSDIKEKEEDIKQAEHLLAIADEEARLLEQVEVPETKPAPRKKPVKVEALEERAEEKEEKRLTREEQFALERLLATAPPRSDELFHRVAHLPSDVLYSTAKEIYNRQRATGIETAQDREAIYAIRKGLEIKKEDAEEGQYRPSAKAKHLLSAAENMTESMYKGAGEGWYRKGA